MILPLYLLLNMNNENKDKMAGETMFEYLKRSKRLALENSLSRSKFKAPLNEVGLNVSRSQKTSCE